MPTLISCQGITKQFGVEPLFANLSVGIEAGDHLGIVGPNGSGKSTLLKIFAGEVLPDEGVVAPRKGLRLAYVQQQSVFASNATVSTAIVDSMKRHGVHADQHLAELSQILGRVGFENPDEPVANLSGGWRKRLSIACALATEPELLLLDEPTNHLDFEGILWLEKLLRNANFAFAVISHDRYFLENATNRMLEINRAFPGNIFSVQGNYSQYLERKDDFLKGQLAYQASLANKVRREVEWLRQGAKARTTKQQARIQAAEQLQGELAELKSKTRESSVSIDFTASGRKTKKLIRLVDVNKAYGDKRLLTDLNLVLSPGVRLGMLGLNASGKSTLLKILCGEVKPDSGAVETADKLRVVYFEQNRATLDPNITLRRTLAPEGDSVVTSERTVHVASWAKKFLFRSEQLDVPVGKLSGGEQSRLVIAKIMLQPADVLLLDEPTNDLDIPTLEVLEDSLGEFPGAIVLVTHDRYMLDRISNVLLALDGEGGSAYYADLHQWLQASISTKKRAVAEAKKSSTQGQTEFPSDDSAKSQTKKKLSYKEQREFDLMEATIADAEKKLADCQKRVDDPASASNSIKLQEYYQELQKAQNLVETLYARWAELESKIT